MSGGRFLREINRSVLSAMRLKQCRVPSTFSLLYFFTNSLTCSMDVGEYRLLVLYSILPAQFCNFSPCSQLVIGEITVPAANAADNLRKVRFFIFKWLYAKLKEKGGPDAEKKYPTPVLISVRR